MKLTIINIVLTSIACLLTRELGWAMAAVAWVVLYLEETDKRK
jgi:hypothetical protein